MRPLWEALEREGSGTIFQSFRWNLAAARHLAAREQPYVIAMDTDSGAVIVPAATAGAHATFLGESLFDYRDVLAAGDSSLLPEALCELGKTRRDLRLPAVRQDAVLGCGTREPWVGAPLVRRSLTDAEQFLDQHFRAHKQMRRLMRAGASFARYDANDATLLGWLYRHKALQFAGSGLDIFSDPARRACILEICAASGPLAEVFAIELGSALIAALVTFREPAVRRLYTIWHDAAREDLSPGVVLLLHAVHASLQEGLDVDFLTGEQPHKTRFANDRVQLFRLQASAAQLMGEEQAVPLAA